MKQKLIIFTLFLSAVLFVGCGHNNEITVDSAMLTEAEAKEIALANVPGATTEDIYEFKKDTDDSVIKYEGEIRYDGMEYEFEIHAYDGTVLEWDEDPLR